MAAGAVSSLILAMATSDCEAIRDAWLAQPANAWSSGAYLLAGGYLAVRHRASLPGSAALTAAVLSLGAVAVGSVLYHGPQPAWGDAVHDATIALLLGALASLGGTARSPQGFRHRAVPVVAVLAAVLVVVVPGSVALAHGALAGLVAVRHVGAATRGSLAPATRVALVALVAGTVLFAAGRTGGPLCEPRSLAQPHAGWHVATAIAAAALVTTDVHGRRRRTTP